MENQLRKEMELLMEEDGKMITDFYKELRNCMGEEDQKQFDLFFKSMSERREERVRNIQEKMGLISVS